MSNKRKGVVRLGVRFHQTFMPERNYLFKLLSFIDGDGEGTDLEISAKTGIPTGKSSGKVPAILKYAQGMGLIQIRQEAGKRRLDMTDLGGRILRNDPHMGWESTQWLLHLHLCRRIGGAEVWHRCFGSGWDVLGRRFSRDQLEAYLSGYYGKAKRSLIGPMIRTYEDPAALKKCGALKIEAGAVRRQAAPLSAGSGNACAGFFLTLWDAHFPEDRQTTVNNFEGATRWAAINGWDDHRVEQALDMLKEKEAIDIDRHMRPWVLTRRAEAARYWRTIYQA